MLHLVQRVDVRASRVPWLQQREGMRAAVPAAAAPVRDTIRQLRAAEVLHLAVGWLLPQAGSALGNASTLRIPNPNPNPQGLTRATRQHVHTSTSTWPQMSAPMYVRMPPVQPRQVLRAMPTVQSEARRAARAHVAHRRCLRGVSRHGRLAVPSDLASAASAGAASVATRASAARAAVSTAPDPVSSRGTSASSFCAAGRATRPGRSLPHRRSRCSPRNRCLVTVRPPRCRRGWRIVGRLACQPEHRGGAQRTGGGVPLFGRRTAVLPAALPPPSQRRTRRRRGRCCGAQRRPRGRQGEPVADPANW